MSDNIPVNKQRECADETYLLDIFSCVQCAERNGQIETHKQLFLYITWALGNNRSAFLQEEKTRVGMMRVYSDRFCWKRSQTTGLLVAKLEMGDFQAVKTVERRKIDEMRLPEKITYTLPPCDASTMKIVTKMINESLTGETLLETGQLNVQLSVLPHMETKLGVEHDYHANQPTESSPATEEHTVS